MNNPTTTTTSSPQQEQHQQQPSVSSSNANHNTVESDEPNPNLFWLPARLHPEIAPQEFKAFIEEATKPENLLRRTSSALGSRRNSGDHLQPSGLSRKKSMLSQIYDPTNDPLPSSSQQHHRPEKAITRGYSMSSPRNLGRGAQGLESLTINDLQLLESLVLKKSSSPSNDTSLDSQFHHLNLNDDRIRAVISRSMTIGGSASSPSGQFFSSLFYIHTLCLYINIYIYGRRQTSWIMSTDSFIQRSSLQKNSINLLPSFQIPNSTQNN
jgi:hypothetical protein